MSSLDALQYQPGAAPGPELAAGDPRWQRIAALAADGDYRVAADAASELFDEGARDVRVLCHGLLGVFLERGVEALPDLFEGVTAWLTAGWAALGPARRKEAISDTSLGWLFRTMLEQASFHEQQHDEAWQAACRAFEAPLLQRTQAAIAGARAAMGAALGEPASAEPLGRLEAWIRRSLAPAARAAQEDAARAAARAREDAEEREAERRREDAADHEGEGDEERDSEDEDDDDGEDDALEPTASSGRPARAAVLALEISPALALLLRKLEAFRVLCEREEIARAAIVAHDLQRTIEAFDPRRYLPGILGAYCGLLSARIADIAPCWDDTESPAWRALEQLYEVDLDAFVQGDA